MHTPDALRLTGENIGAVLARWSGMSTRVLVVSGDRALSTSLEADLSANGFVSEIAKGVEDAIDRLESVDAVVASQFLPGLDGALFVRRVKDSPVRKPVVLLSVVSSASAVRDISAASGADAVLPRSWTVKGLVAELHRVAAPKRVHAPPQKASNPAAAPGAALDPAWLLGRAFADAVTGSLTFEREGERIALWLSRGRPLHVVLGHGTDEAEISPDRCADVLVSLFGWTKAQVSFEAGELPPDLLAVALDREPILVEGLRRHYGVERLLAALLDTSRLLIPARLPTTSVSRLRFHPEEDAALRLLDGRRTVAEAIASASDRETALRAIYACLCLGLLVDVGPDACELLPELDVAEDESHVYLVRSTAPLVKGAVLSPEERLEGLVAEGERALLDEEPDAAATAFRRVLELQPDHRFALLALAHLHPGSAPTP